MRLFPKRRNMRFLAGFFLKMHKGFYFSVKCMLKQLVEIFARAGK